MTYTLSSGVKGSVSLDEEQVENWIKCYLEGRQFITNLDDELFGLNPTLVADFKVHNKFSEQREYISTVHMLSNYELEKAYKHIQRTKGKA